jgi:hypothetical protein
MTLSDHLPSTTTAEQDRDTAGERATSVAADREIGRKSGGQRRINLIWEVTQALIAVGVTAAMIWAELHNQPADNLSRAFTLIIAIYFVRMNHTKVGGIVEADSR